jgi:hypothetical protein
VLLNDVPVLLARRLLGRLLRMLRLKARREPTERAGRFVVGVVDAPPGASGRG